MADVFATTSTSWDADHLVVDDKLRGTVDDLRRLSQEFRRQWAPRSPITDAPAATVLTLRQTARCWLMSAVMTPRPTPPPLSQT